MVSPNTLGGGGGPPPTKISKLLYMAPYFTYQQNVNNTCGYNLQNTCM